MGPEVQEPSATSEGIRLSGLKNDLLKFFGDSSDSLADFAVDLQTFEETKSELENRLRATICR